MMDTNDKNGSWRYMLVALGLIGVLTTGAFLIGLHIGNGDIHQTTKDAIDMVREEVDRTVKPLRDDIQRVETKVDKLLDKE